MQIASLLITDCPNMFWMQLGYLFFFFYNQSGWKIKRNKTKGKTSNFMHCSVALSHYDSEINLHVLVAGRPSHLRIFKTTKHPPVMNLYLLVRQCTGKSKSVLFKLLSSAIQQQSFWCIWMIHLFQLFLKKRHRRLWIYNLTEPNSNMDHF